jgi:branched-chain amino acid transport system ATP-binding protein
MAEAQLAIENLVKHFGGLVATDSLSLDVREGELHAIIGPNGAGKTTLIAQITGELRQNGGTIRFAGEEITRLDVPQRVHRGLARSFQITQLLADFTALDNVAMAVQARQGHSFRFWRDARSDPRLREPALRFLAQAGLENRAGMLVSDLSHGEQKQLELAIALATQPRFLLLDEPMAGLGATESRAMTATLLALKGRISMLLVEHDMDAVFALADRITVLVRGGAIATGTPAEIRVNAEVRAAYLADEEL